MRGHTSGRNRLGEAQRPAEPQESERDLRCPGHKRSGVLRPHPEGEEALVTYFSFGTGGGLGGFFGSSCPITPASPNPVVAINRPMPASISCTALVADEKA